MLVGFQRSKAFAVEAQLAIQTGLQTRVAGVEDLLQQQADLAVFLARLMPVVVASSDVHAPDRVDLILLGEFCEENGGFGREVVVDAHHFLTFGKHTDGTATEWVAAGVEVNLRRFLGRFRWLRACLKMGTPFSDRL